MTMSFPQTVAYINILARTIGPHIAEEFGNGSGGGYLYIGDGNNKKKLLSKIGTPAAEKDEKYRLFAKEKADRLCSNPKHDLSWQSQDLKLEWYQGSIKVISPFRAFVSFSGFPSAVDEALCLILSKKSGLLTAQSVEGLSNISGNSELTHKMWLFAKEIW